MGDGPLFKYANCRPAGVHRREVQEKPKQCRSQTEVPPTSQVPFRRAEPKNRKPFHRSEPGKERRTISWLPKPNNSAVSSQLRKIHTIPTFGPRQSQQRWWTVNYMLSNEHLKGLKNQKRTWTGYGRRASLASRSIMTATGYHCLAHRNPSSSCSWKASIPGIYV